MSVFVDNDLMITWLFIILKRHPDRLKKKLRYSKALNLMLISPRISGNTNLFFEGGLYLLLSLLSHFL